MSMYFGSGNYDPAVRAGTIQNNQTVQAAIAGAPVLLGAKTVSDAEVQWAFQDTDLAREFDYAEVVFVASSGGLSTPVYLDSSPVPGSYLGAKTLNTIRQWVLQVEIATGAITVYETRLTVPHATTMIPGVTRYATLAEAAARAAVDAAVRPQHLPVVPPLVFANMAEALAGTDTDKVMNARRTREAIVARINDLVGSAPGALDTLQELADALGDDPNFATTIANMLALKANIDSPVLTGNPTAPTPAGSDRDTSIATTGFVAGAISRVLYNDAEGGTTVRLSESMANFSMILVTATTSGTANANQNTSGTLRRASIPAARNANFGLRVGTGTAAVWGSGTTLNIDRAQIVGVIGWR